MLDKRTSIFLKSINEHCSEGSFKVIDYQSLVSAMPEKFKIDKDNIKQMLDYLTSREFIVVKFADDKEVCLAPLPRGRLYNEKEQEIKAEKKQDRRSLIYTIAGAALAAFAGAALAVLIFR